MKKEKLPVNMKGKCVSRAAFAKMQAEKQRLMEDIRLMVSGSAEGGVTWNKWRKHFKFEAQLNQALREIAKEELPKLQAKYKDLADAKIDSNKKSV